MSSIRLSAPAPTSCTASIRQGFWTVWEKREDWDKSPTGILYGEPKPKYIIFQYFANEGAKSWRN